MLVPIRHFIYMGCILLTLTGCTETHLVRSDATDYKRTYSYAINPKTDTVLRRAVASGVKAHGGQSGFKLLTTGAQSLDARLALLRAAERSIDLQYYTTNDDITGNILLAGVLRAAERGVRVRFLIDAVSLDDIGESLALLDKNKNIEIRVFNPPTTKDQGLFAITSYFVDINQIDKRMHNKVFIVDNQMAIIGGRNLGDEYFDENPENSNFKDLDVLTVGPMADQISHSFDRYWNDDQSFPIDLVQRAQIDPEHVKQMKAKLEENWQKYKASHPDNRKDSDRFLSDLTHGQVPLIWSKAEMVADDANKIDPDINVKVSRPLAHLAELTDHADSEFLIVSPYFVPQDSGLQWLTDLAQKGIDVKILTNSLSSTDVVLVQTGYNRYREDLVKNGVDLYELKRQQGEGKPRQRVLATTAPPYASLHAKTYVVDRKHVVIGSFNFDPRSIRINTEMALVIHSPVIARQVAHIFEQSTALENSYHLKNQNGQLIWVTQDQGRLITYTNDPEVSVWRRMQTFFMSLLPVEDKL